MRWNVLRLEFAIYLGKSDYGLLFLTSFTNEIMMHIMF